MLKDGQRAGYIRLEEREQGEQEISLAVTPSCRGQRVATGALAQVLDRAKSDHRTNKVLAVVHRQNMDSLKLFSRSGFVQSPEGLSSSDFILLVLNTNSRYGDESGE